MPDVRGKEKVDRLQVHVYEMREKFLGILKLRNGIGKAMHNALQELQAKDSVCSMRFDTTKLNIGRLS